jgi:hypothetical protein
MRWTTSKSLTSVVLDSGRHFSSANGVKESHFLPEDSPKVLFPDPLGISFAGVRPDVHENVGGCKKTET